MRRCPPEENVLTRFGWCKYYSFEDNGEVTLAGPQSSLTFYAGSLKFLNLRLISLNLAYNTSDATTGTLRYVDGMTIFYW